MHYHKNARPGGRLPVKGIPQDARTVILHTRNATMGDPAFNRNNHPVISMSGDTVLVHNGIVKNHMNFRKAWPDLAEVDSSVLPELVENHGLKGIAEITGWAAVAWLSRNTPGVLHLARQGDAPLILVSLTDGSTVFASTFGIILVALQRMGLEDLISWGYEFVDHQALDLTEGRISHLDTIPAYNYQSSIYKAGTTATTTYQTQAEKEEEKRLRAITMGEKYTPPKSTTTKTPPKSTPGPVVHTPPKPSNWNPQSFNSHQQHIGAVGVPLPSVYHTKEVKPQKVTLKDAPEVSNTDMEARLAAFDTQADRPTVTYHGPATGQGSAVVRPFPNHQSEYRSRGFLGSENEVEDDDEYDSIVEFMSGHRRPLDWPSGNILYDDKYVPFVNECLPGELPPEIEECMIYWIDFSDGTTTNDYRDYEDFVCSHRLAFEEGILSDWGFCSPFDLDKRLSLKAMKSQADEIATIVFNIDKLNAEHAKSVAKNTKVASPATRTASKEGH